MRAATLVVVIADVVALTVEDIAPNGYAVARATVRQKKTGRRVRFELSEQTRQAVEAYLKAATKIAAFAGAKIFWVGDCRCEGENLFGLHGRCRQTALH
jgi:hypothetical protein